MKCWQCGFNEAKAATECRNCNADLLNPPASAKVSHVVNRTPYQEAKIIAANHDCRKYKLAPRRLGETDEQFIERVRIESSDAVVAEIQRMGSKPQPPIPPAREREPGEDG